MEILNAILSIGKTLGEVIAALVAAGMSHDEAAEVIRRDLESRLAQVRADRAARDAEFARKHGEQI